MRKGRKSLINASEPGKDKLMFRVAALRRLCASGTGARIESERYSARLRNRCTFSSGLPAPIPSESLRVFAGMRMWLAPKSPGFRTGGCGHNGFL